MNKTKKLIFNSGIKAFSTNGYEGATMDDISTLAGLAKGTLYYHFKNKEEIFKYIITEGLNLIQEELELIVSREDSPLLKFKLLFKTHLLLICRYKDFFRIILSEVWGQELRQLEIRKILQKHILYLEKHILYAIDAGIIKKQNPSFAIYSLLGTLCSTAMYELICINKNELDDAIDYFMNNLLNGFLLENN